MKHWALLKHWPHATRLGPALKVTPRRPSLLLLLLLLLLLVFHRPQDLLKGVHGAIQSNHLLALMGPSGSGKTTLLDTLAGRLATNLTMSGEVSRWTGEGLAVATGCCKT